MLYLFHFPFYFNRFHQILSDVCIFSKEYFSDVVIVILTLTFGIVKCFIFTRFQKKIYKMILIHNCIFSN